jgi:hypothetical protein
VGTQEIQSDPDLKTRIILNPAGADITAGGNGQNGDLIIKDSANAERIRIGHVTETIAIPDQPTPIVVSEYNGIYIHNSGGSYVKIGRVPKGTIQNPANEIQLAMGAGGLSGGIWLYDAQGKARLILGNDGSHDGRIVVRTADGKEILEFDSSTAALYVGAQGNEGDVIVRNGSNQETIKLDSGEASIAIRVNEQLRLRLENGNAWLGGNGDDGDLVIFKSGGDNKSLDKATIHFSGEGGSARIGGAGANGLMTFQSSDNKNRIRLEGGPANIWLGGNGADGDLVIFKSDGDNTTSDNASIHLNGQAGDIILRNADCAEEFQCEEGVEPGTVMVIEDEGMLRSSTRAYDKRVAGVVSGLGDYRPGILLDRRPGEKGRLPIALSGKVYCRVDAEHGSVDVGDLLTTSPTPGHAMKAADPTQTPGSVIGKALRPLASGSGLIPILVSLQ